MSSYFSGIRRHAPGRPARRGSARGSARETSRAAAQDASGSPNDTACRAAGAGLARRRRARAARLGISAAASSISARTGVMPRVPMISRAGDQRAEPVREVDDLLAGDAGEEVLVAAGEADHLVREDRPDDERDVVLDDGPVEPDVDRPVAAAPRTARGSASAGMVPRSTKVVRLPPLVVEHGQARDRSPPGRPRRSRGAGQCASAHRGVGAERDQHGQPADPAGQGVVHRARAAAAAGSCGCASGTMTQTLRPSRSVAASCSRDELAHLRRGRSTCARTADGRRRGCR